MPNESFNFRRNRNLPQQDILAPDDQLMHWLAIEHARDRLRLRTVRLKSGREALELQLDGLATRQLALGAVRNTPFVGLQPALLGALRAVKWRVAEARLTGGTAWLILSGQGPQQTPMRLIMPANPVGFRKFMAGKRVPRLDLRGIKTTGSGRVAKVAGRPVQSIKLMRRKVSGRQAPVATAQTQAQTLSFNRGFKFGRSGKQQKG